MHFIISCLLFLFSSPSPLCFSSSESLYKINYYFKPESARNFFLSIFIIKHVTIIQHNKSISSQLMLWVGHLSKIWVFGAQFELHRSRFATQGKTLVLMRWKRDGCAFYRRDSHWELRWWLQVQIRPLARVSFYTLGLIYNRALPAVLSLRLYQNIFRHITHLLDKICT